VLFIWLTPGYSQNLMSYLFGNILMVSATELWLVAGLDALVLVASLLCYKQLVAVCFDEEFARLRGVPVEFYYLLLLGLTALTVVLLVTVVGLVMVVALLSLPVAIAGHFSRSLKQVMVIAAVLSAAFTTLGLAASYGADMPSGAVTIVMAGAAYLLVAVGVGLGARARRRRGSPPASPPQATPCEGPGPQGI